MLTYDPPDADYGRIFTQARIIAWQYGFALVTHGSRTRDLDVLMVPWEERAYDKIVPAVINRIAQVTGTTLKGEPTDKPHGRKAYTLFLPDGVRWVDLSVMPCAPKVSTAVAGHVLTLRDHRCGDFKDEFDWTSLPPHYLRRVGWRNGEGSKG